MVLLWYHSIMSQIIGVITESCKVQYTRCCSILGPTTLLSFIPSLGPSILASTPFNKTRRATLILLYHASDLVPRACGHILDFNPDKRKDTIFSKWCFIWPTTNNSYKVANSQLNCNIPHQQRTWEMLSMLVGGSNRTIEAFLEGQPKRNKIREGYGA